MSMTKEQLHDWLDAHFASVIDEAKDVAPDLDEVERVGTISGLLIATGIQLAAKNSAPRATVERAVLALIDGAFDED